MKKKILIVGGTGFIGFYVAKKALKKNFYVESISTKKPQQKRKVKKVKYLICDISKKEKLKKVAKRKYDYVVNLGGYVNHSDKDQVYKSHYLGCKNLVQIFLNSKIKSFVQLGSGAEYGDVKSPIRETAFCKPKAPYGKAKLKSTLYLQKMFKKNNFPATILRLFQAYGPKQDLNRVVPITINSCIKNKSFPCSNGKQLRDFIHVNDVVEAIFKSFKNKSSTGEIINIGSGRPIKIRGLIKKIVHLTGGGKPEFGQIPLRRDETKKNFPDISKAKKILKWKNKINLLMGLKKTIKSYKQ